ncbi:MAG: hypothetical protein R3F56_03075 [Planctomycetota bacterium]
MFASVRFWAAVCALGIAIGMPVAWSATRTAELGSVVYVPFDRVATFSGAANGKCCNRDAVLCYGGAQDSGNCIGALPWSCTCTNSGANCWKVTDIKRSDVCVNGNPTDNCTVIAVEGCWLKTAGSCAGGVGPWSWGGFCWTCGCDPGPGGVWQAAYDDCGTSTNCVFNPV